MRFWAVVILCFTLSLTVRAQQEIDDDYLSILLAEEEEHSSAAFKPVIGFGVGNFSFYGDVTDYFKSPINGLTSYRFQISRNINKYIDIEFHGTLGKVGGSVYNAENTSTIDFSSCIDKTSGKFSAEQIEMYRKMGRFDVESMKAVANFRSQLFIGGVSVVYNFNHLLERKRPIHPYISLGVEFFQFASKGDMLNSAGEPYNYWYDGTIRNDKGELIVRDYEYETDLRSLNLYGYGEYSKTSVAVPIDLGLNITVSDRVTCRFGSVAHLPFTDYVDNVKGGKSFWKNDIVLNTYVSLAFDLFSNDDEIAAVENFRNLKFIVTDHQDEDGDGVDDFNDECPGTPKDVKVNQVGCPVDSDKDGVPDYLDKEEDTPFGSIVNTNGIRMTDAQIITLIYNPDAVGHNETRVYSATSEASGANESAKPKGIPDKFKSVDKNMDNYISHEELQQAIDLIFEGESNLTPADINELQDFFFEQ